MPWLVCEDFNDILYSFEKKGGVPRCEQRMKEFRRTLDETKLVDIGFFGPWFT